MNQNSCRSEWMLTPVGSSRWYPPMHGPWRISQYHLHHHHHYHRHHYRHQHSRNESVKRCQRSGSLIGVAPWLDPDTHPVVVVVVLMFSIYTSRRRLPTGGGSSSNGVHALCELPTHVRHLHTFWSRNTGSAMGYQITWNSQPVLRCVRTYPIEKEYNIKVDEMLSCFSICIWRFPDSWMWSHVWMPHCSSVRPFSLLDEHSERPLSNCKCLSLLWLLTASYFKGLILYETSG